MASSRLSGPKRVKRGWMRIGNDHVATSKGCRNDRKGIGDDVKILCKELPGRRQKREGSCESMNCCDCLGGSDIVAEGSRTVCGPRTT